MSASLSGKLAAIDEALEVSAAPRRPRRCLGSPSDHEGASGSQCPVEGGERRSPIESWVPRQREPPIPSGIEWEDGRFSFVRNPISDQFNGRTDGRIHPLLEIQDCILQHFVF